MCNQVWKLPVDQRVVDVERKEDLWIRVGRKEKL